MNLARLIRDVPDFPEPGILFRDITPLLADGPAFASVVETMAERVEAAAMRADRIVGIESRGFILGAPLATHLGLGFAPVRKPGKLPWETESEEYALEYGTDRLEIHRDAVRAGESVLIVDDVIATGGTAAATARLVEKLGGTVAGFVFLVELGFLGGRAKIAGYPIESLVTY